MKVLVFGSTGQVAQALARLHPGVECLDRTQADLSAPEVCAEAIGARRPDAVINAAAWTAVDRAEADEAAATVINGAAPGAMARACAALAIPLVQLSTDYVFDGSGTTAWAPDAPTAPLNAYGRSKLAGERAVRAAGGRAAILRTSWVFSADGANFVKTMLHLSQSRDALRVVDDQVGGPTPAGAIARAALHIAQAMADGREGGTWHVAGRPFVSWAGFAHQIMACAGWAVRIEPIATADWPTPAARPLNSRLDCTTLLRDFGLDQPDWKAQLRADIRRLTQ